MTLSLASSLGAGAVEVWLDGPSAAASGNLAGSVPVPATAGLDTFTAASTTLSARVTGTHRVFFVFRGTGFRMANRQFLP